MLAVALEHGAALPVGRVGLRRVFAAETDATGLGIEADAQILHDAGAAFQLGKESGHALGVVPDVRAGAVAAADPFPGPKSAVPPPLHRVGRQRADRFDQPGQEPVGQRAVEIGVVEEPRQVGQAIEILLQVLRDVVRVANQFPYMRPCSPPAKCQQTKNVTSCAAPGSRANS